MERFYVLIVVCGVLVAGSLGMVAVRVQTLGPAPGAVEASSELAFWQREREQMEERVENVTRTRGARSFQIENLLQKLQVDALDLVAIQSQAHNDLRRAAHDMRSAAERLLNACGIYDAEQATYREQVRHRQQMAGRLGAQGVTLPPLPEPPRDHDVRNAAVAFAQAYREYGIVVQRAAIDARRQLNSVRQRVLESLNALADIEIQSIADENELLAVQSELNKLLARVSTFLHDFGQDVGRLQRLQALRVDKESWRKTIETFIEVVSGALSDSVINDIALREAERDAAVQAAIEQIRRRGL